MVRTGIVIRLDRRSKSGLIRDDNSGLNYFFHKDECKDEVLPVLGDKVSFVKEKANFIPVAVLVQSEK